MQISLLAQYSNTSQRYFQKLQQQMVKEITLILAFFGILTIVDSRIYNKQFSIGEVRRSKGWLFLDRMAFDKGVISISLKIKIDTPTVPQSVSIPLELAMVPDDMWMQEEAFRCEGRKQIGDTIVLYGELKRQQDYSTTVTHQTTVEQSTNFHFVLRDCKKLLANQYFRKETKLQVRLQMLNGDYGHGSDQSVNKYMLPFLLIMTAVMAYYSKGPKHGEQLGQQKDWAKFILFITLAFNFVALLFNYLGFLIYLWSGQSYGFFDFMYLLFHSISESVLTSLIIFIAYGWTITFTKDAQFDLYIPLVSMLGLINLILTLLGKINDGDSDKYHMYDTIPSYLLVFFRVCTVVIFAIGIIRLYLSSSKNAQLISFIANFGFMGAIYFLSLPGIMLLASFLPVGSRKQIVFFSVELIKNTVNLILTWMVSSKKSKYKNIQHSSTSFFQSGNKLL